jgi:hypothetical protein
MGFIGEFDLKRRNRGPRSLANPTVDREGLFESNPGEDDVAAIKTFCLEGVGWLGGKIHGMKWEGRGSMVRFFIVAASVHPTTVDDGCAAVALFHNATSTDNPLPSRIRFNQWSGSVDPDPAETPTVVAVKHR